MIVILLESEDGKDYTSAVLIQDEEDIARVEADIENALETAKAGKEGLWEWDRDIVPALRSVPGVIWPSVVVHGPTWDRG